MPQQRIKEEKLFEIIEISYKCDQCGRAYGDESKLLEHVQHEHTHHEMGSFSVKAAQVSPEPPADDDKSLEYDNVSDAQQQHVFLCSQCSCKFESGADLEKHFNVCDGGNNVADNTNTNTATTKITLDNLKVSVRLHIPPQQEELHTCSECNKSFKKLDNFERHNCKRRSIRIFICADCGATYRSKDNLDHHINKKHNPDYGKDGFQFACNLCSYSTDNKHRLIIHMRSHTGERPYQCSYCTKAFAQPGGLSIHIKGVHMKMRPYTCEMCGLKHTTKSALKQHIEIVHLKLKPFECSVCGMHFSKKHHLNRHATGHSMKPGPYVCDVCGFCTHRKDRLSAHKQKHKEKTYTCEACSKPFARLDHLKRHISNIHSRMKPFVCGRCGLSFARNEKLSAHMSKHSGVTKPYMCHICSAEFNKAGALVSHMSSLHQTVSDIYFSKPQKNKKVVYMCRG